MVIILVEGLLPIHLELYPSTMALSTVLPLSKEMFRSCGVNITLEKRGPNALRTTPGLQLFQQDL